MFIDIHAHAYREVRNHPNRFVTAEELLAAYDRIGVERGVLLPLASQEFNLPQTNEETLDIAGRHADRFIPFCNVDLRAWGESQVEPIGAILRRYRDMGCRGVGEVISNVPFFDPLAQSLFEAAQEMGWPIIFHVATQIGGMYGLYDDPGLPQFEQCLKRFPALKFLGHSPAFWSEIAALDKPEDRNSYPNYPVRAEGVLPRLFRQYPNLHGDLSAGSGHNALARDPDHGVKFLEEFQDRLLFGMDICCPGREPPLPGFLTGLRDSGKISEAIFNKIARENALELLGLG